MIRLATFNMENLFSRPVAMNQDNEAEAAKRSRITRPPTVSWQRRCMRPVTRPSCFS